jgi:hypothetical protein
MYHFRVCMCACQTLISTIRSYACLTTTIVNKKGSRGGQLASLLNPTLSPDSYLPCSALLSGGACPRAPTPLTLRLALRQSERGRLEILHD